MLEVEDESTQSRPATQWAQQVFVKTVFKSIIRSAFHIDAAELYDIEELKIQWDPRAEKHFVAVDSVEEL